MFKFAAAQKDYLFLNISELRQKVADLMDKIRRYKIVVMKNGKPAMMIVDYEEYQHQQEIMEAEENDYFADVAKERVSDKGQKLYTHEEVTRKLGK